MDGHFFLGIESAMMQVLKYSAKSRETRENDETRSKYVGKLVLPLLQ